MPDGPAVPLVALVESPDHVCCRYRLAAFRDSFAAAGYPLDLQPLPKPWWARLRLFRRLRGGSVLVQRRLLPVWQLAWLRGHVRHLLFDFDDAVFLRDSYARRGLRHGGRLRRFAATVRRCDAVIAGNRFLADQAARWADPSRVAVIPTCVDPGRSPVAAARPAAGVELAWVGSSSTLQGLEASADLWDEVARRVPGVRLRVVCDRFPTFRHMPVVRCPWSAATEAEALAAADIGVSWVPEDDWSRGKCGLKVLQYMAAGLPVVANPVGVHTEMVTPGETGYLARTPGEWAEAIGRLAADPAMRLRLGRAGRARLEADYSVAAGGRRWVEVLHRLDRPARHCA